MEQTYSLDQIDAIAQLLCNKLTDNVLLFSGEMGAGKTTLIKSLCRVMGITDVVSSPTFSLINEYRTPSNKAVYHFDCYRIESSEEALDFGAEEYLYSDQLCLIEWGDRIANILPEQYQTVQLEKIDDTRRKLTLK